MLTLTAFMYYIRRLSILPLKPHADLQELVKALHELLPLYKATLFDLFQSHLKNIKLVLKMLG
eukprot:XP_001708109.1 Hypothetical protein GL50803_112728 [Giardia lamblia ATCC 50803]